MKDLSGGWAWKTMAEVAEVKSGSTPKTTEPAYWGGGVPWITPKDLASNQEKLIERGARNITDEGLASCSAQLLPAGTVLFSTRAPIGYVAIAAEAVATNQGFKNFVPGPEVSSDYLYWYLRGAKALAESLSSGTTFKELSGKAAGKMPIPVPPREEQEAIVEAIEKQFTRVDAGLTLILNGRDKLLSLRGSIIDSLVENDEWPRQAWGEVGQSQNGRAFPSKDYSREGIKLLRPGNLHRSGRVEWTDSNTRMLPLRYAEDHPAYVVGPGEVVMNLTAQSLKDEFLGRVCLTGPDEHCLLNQRIARLKPAEFLIPEFLLFALKTRRFRRFVDSLNKGSLIQHMFTSQLADYQVPVPPLDEQRRIISDVEARLSVADAAGERAALTIRRAGTLRSAILERAFVGGLTSEVAQ